MSGETTLRIQERFVSIQGEGVLAGTPSSFVRLSGCNLRCTWCDSPASSWAPEGQHLALEAILEACAAGPRHVVVTGGEPLLFPGVVGLTQRLAAAGHHITVETAGTVDQDHLRCDLASLSPKLAHSTPHTRAPTLADRHERLRWQPDVVRALMRFPWQLKFVVRAEREDALATDVQEIEAMLREIDVGDAERERVLLMPECVDPLALPDRYARLADVCTQRGFRLGPRLHITMFGHTPGT